MIEVLCGRCMLPREDDHQCPTDLITQGPPEKGEGDIREELHNKIAILQAHIQMLGAENQQLRNQLTYAGQAYAQQAQQAQMQIYSQGITGTAGTPSFLGTWGIGQPSIMKG